MINKIDIIQNIINKIKILYNITYKLSNMKTNKISILCNFILINDKITLLQSK